MCTLKLSILKSVHKIRIECWLALKCCGLWESQWRLCRWVVKRIENNKRKRIETVKKRDLQMYCKNLFMFISVKETCIAMNCSGTIQSIRYQIKSHFYGTVEMECVWCWIDTTFQSLPMFQAVSHVKTKTHAIRVANLRW